ncbi:MAG: hypothetical protein ACPG8W_17900 [Candidatus Promineifilaceae bacterium]
MTQRNIWINPIDMIHYLIPETFVFPSGNFLLVNLSDQRTLTIKNAVHSFEVTQDDINTYIEQLMFKAAPSVVDVGARLLEPKNVAAINKAAESVKTIFEQVEGMSAFDQTQVEQILTQAGIASSEKSANPITSEQAFHQFGDMLVTFSGIVDDPEKSAETRIDEAIAALEETWGERIGQPTSKQQKQAQHKRINTAVRNNIAAGLRSRGITPLTM